MEERIKNISHNEKSVLKECNPIWLLTREQAECLLGQED